jgi:hypothetical protein
MNRLILLAAAIALAPACWGQLYKYVDKDGKTVYTDQPPNADSKALKAAPPSPATAPPAKPAAEKAKAPEKAPLQARDGARKPPPAPLTEAEREERCQAARAEYVIYLDGGPITVRNTRTGELSQLDEKQAEVEKEKARVAMEEACKKP